MYRRTDNTPTLPTLPAPQPTRRGLARLPAHRRVAVLAALASLALATFLTMPVARPAQAAPTTASTLSCNGPCVGITNPNYFPQGVPVAEGPVGTKLTVEGSNWPPGTLLTVWPAPDAATCAAQLAQPPSYAGQISVVGSGSARGSYIWPQAADTVNQTYTLCAVDGAVTVSPTVQSDGVDTYTVLAANPPSVSVAPTTITQGQDTILAISGENWLPQQPLNVTICADITNCSSTSVASQTTGSAQDGTFSANITLKGTTNPGSYYVQVISTNGALQAPPNGTPAQLTVSTPTPTPTPTPSPTPTPTPTPRPPSPNKGGGPLLVILLGMLSLLFLIGGIISIVIYTRGGP